MASETAAISRWTKVAIELSGQASGKSDMSTDRLNAAGHSDQGTLRITFITDQTQQGPLRK